ncbi:hypothetical protein AAF134_06380 [Synechococcus lacustris Tous-12m]
MAIDEFCKQLVRSNPAAMAEWLLGVSGVDGSYGYEVQSLQGFTGN